MIQHQTTTRTQQPSGADEEHPVPERSTPDLKRWLTTEQVAELLQVNIRYVHKLVKRGELPVCTLGPRGTLWRVDPQDLNTYMARRRTSTASGAC